MSTAPYPFPRFFGESIAWLGACLPIRTSSKTVHSYTSAFLVTGSQATLMIDTGHSRFWDDIEAGLEAALRGRPLDYIFPTHAEMPHIGSLRRLAAKYPEAIICGDARSSHLFYPDLAARWHHVRPGDRLGLGGAEFVFVEAAIHDLANTLWGYEVSTRALFVSDGLGFSHDHGVGQCALTAEELPDLPSPQDVALLNDSALYWLRYTDIDPVFASLDRVLGEYPPALILPAHGSVITDPGATVDAIKDGMRRVRERTRATVLRGGGSK